MIRLLDDLRRDFRHAVRLMGRTPALTVSAVLSLALGIGGNTAIFSVIDSLMLRELPVRDPGQLILVEGSLQYSTYQRLRDATPDTAPLAAVVRTDRYNVGIGIGPGVPPALDGGPVRVALASGNYFSTMGVGAGSGRLLSPSDDQTGAAPVAVISEEYWTRRFQKSTEVVGRQLVFGTTSYEVIGVAAHGFAGEWVGRPTDVWIPFVWQPADERDSDRTRECRGHRNRPHRAASLSATGSGAMADGAVRPPNGRGRSGGDSRTTRADRDGKNRAESRSPRVLSPTRILQHLAVDSDGFSRRGAVDRVRERGQPASDEG